MVICGNCGQQLHDRAVFCDNCGFRLSRPEVVIPMGLPENRIAEQQKNEKRQLAESLFFSALAVMALTCLYLEWLVVKMADEPSALYNSYTLWQLSKSMITTLNFSTQAVVLANVIKVITIIDTVLWAIFIWETVKQSDLKRIFSNLAGVVTICTVVAFSVFVTLVNSSGYEMLNIPQTYGQATLSIAPFIAAISSLILMVVVSLNYADSKHRRNSNSEISHMSKVFSFENVDSEVLVSTLVDLNTLIIASTHPGETRVKVPSLAAGATAATVVNAAYIQEKTINRDSYYEVGGQRVCPLCGAKNRDFHSFCTKCGSSLEGNLCQRCGAILGSEGYCKKCGFETAKNIDEEAVVRGELEHSDGMRTAADLNTTESFNDKICPDCGGFLGESDAFCGNCGSIF